MLFELSRFISSTVLFAIGSVLTVFSLISKVAPKKKKEEIENGLLSNSDYEAMKAQVEEHKAAFEELNQRIIIEESERLQVLYKSRTQLQRLETLFKILSDESKAFKDKLKCEEEHSADLDAQLTAKVAEIHQLEAKVKELEAENERLTIQLVTSKERVAGDRREVVHQNGELNGKSDYEAKKAKEDEKKKAFIVEEISQLILPEENVRAQRIEAKAQLKRLEDVFQILFDTVAFQDSLKDELKFEKLHSADLDAQVRQLTAQVAEIYQLQAELKELRAENERLTNSLVTSKERVAGDGREVVHQNGELNGKDGDDKDSNSGDSGTEFGSGSNDGSDSSEEERVVDACSTCQGTKSH